MLNTINQINYKDYPGCMFAMLSAFVEPQQAEVLRTVAGDAVVRSDHDGCTYKNGVLHSFDDKPAVIFYTQQIWYRDGKIHRDGDLPAHITGDFGKEWYNNGLLHRDGDKPALIQGLVQGWYKNGKKHRDGDLPAVINGYRKQQTWYKNGIMHRKGKHAYIDDERREWCNNGKMYLCLKISEEKNIDYEFDTENEDNIINADSNKRIADEKAEKATKKWKNAAKKSKKAAKKVENAYKMTVEKAENAEKAREKAEKAREKAEKSGEELKRAVEELKRVVEKACNEAVQRIQEEHSSDSEDE